MLDTLEDIKVLHGCGFRILIFSFQWLSWNQPGPGLLFVSNFAGLGPLKPTLTSLTVGSQSIGTPRHLGDAAYAIFSYDSVPGCDRVSEDHAPSERGSLDVALRRRPVATLYAALARRRCQEL